MGLAREKLIDLQDSAQCWRLDLA